MNDIAPRVIAPSHPCGARGEKAGSVGACPSAGSDSAQPPTAPLLTKTPFSLNNGFLIKPATNPPTMRRPALRPPTRLRFLPEPFQQMRPAAVKRALPTSTSRNGHIRQLAERYATPSPQLTDEVAALATRVEGPPCPDGIQAMTGFMPPAPCPAIAPQERRRTDEYLKKMGAA
jgi:hypothetical protein